MSFIENFAKQESRLRPRLTGINPWLSIFLFSNGRKAFLNSLIHQDYKSRTAQLFSTEEKKIWDIKFRSSLFNAAGVFKYGTGYELCAYQGAGAYLCGTTTAAKREGNKKKGILHPFAAFPKSFCAVNWMGLPNEGHELVAKRLSEINKIDGCPVGASVAYSPEHHGDIALNGLLNGLELFDRANVDFIEVNESCPNVPHECSDETIDGLDIYMVQRLEFIAEKFLKKRSRNLPVIVKFSVDTDEQNLPYLLSLLIDLGFDGVNFGNTSTNYQIIREQIVPEEQMLYDYFISNFGGGVSGKALKKDSLNLAAKAATVIKELSLSKEFHVIRTGGISSAEDLIDSKANGISLNQWFTGYFENFSIHGHELYKSMNLLT